MSRDGGPQKRPGESYDATAAIALAGLLPRPDDEEQAALPPSAATRRRFIPPAATVAALREASAGRTLDLSGWQEITPAPAPGAARFVTVAEIAAEWRAAREGLSLNMAWTVPYNGAPAWLERLSARGKPYLLLHDLAAEAGDPPCHAHLTEGRVYIRDPLTLRTELIDLSDQEAGRRLARYRWTHPPQLPPPTRRRNWFRRSR